jgi:hypothetical protein
MTPVSMTRKVAMHDSRLDIPVAASRFFANHLSYLENAPIPGMQRHWYVKRVEEFIRAQTGRKIKGLIGHDISQ